MMRIGLMIAFGFALTTIALAESPVQAPPESSTAEDIATQDLAQIGQLQVTIGQLNQALAEARRQNKQLHQQLDAANAALADAKAKIDKK